MGDQNLVQVLLTNAPRQALRGLLQGARERTLVYGIVQPNDCVLNQSWLAGADQG